MENQCTGHDMGASSFTALSTPNPPQHLGSGSRNVGLLPRHLCPDETFSSISGGDKGRKAHVLVSSEDSGGFSRVLGSHTHSLFLWPEKHLPKESRSIKRVWLVCTQQCTVGSGTFKNPHASAALWTAWWQQTWPARVGVFGSHQAAHWP